MRRIGLHDGRALAGSDILFIGGGQDAQQVQVAGALEGMRDDLVAAVAGGAALFAVCAGYQNLGHGLGAPTDLTPAGPGLFDVDTVTPAGAARRVGGILVELPATSPITALGRASAAAAGIRRLRSGSSGSRTTAAGPTSGVVPGPSDG